MLAQNYNWQFQLPYGKKTDADMLEFMGSTISNINNTSNVKNNIWRNIVNNLNVGEQFSNDNVSGGQNQVHHHHF